MDYVLISDVARYYCVSASLWLIAVLTKFIWDRPLACSGQRRGLSRLGCLLHPQQSPHPLTTMGLIVFMLITTLRRFDSLGAPGDRYLWLVFAGVTLILSGVLINVKFDLRLPWARRKPA